MHRSLWAGAASGACALLLAGPVHAAEAAPPGLEWAVTAGESACDAQERSADGRLLNRETGVLRRNALLLSGPAPGLSPAWRWATQLRHSAGHLSYDGRTQIGLPLVTTTALQDSELTLGLHHRWGWHGPSTAALGAGVGAWRSERDIQPTPLSSRLTETLRAQHVFVAAEVAHGFGLAGWPLRASARLRWARPWAQSLAVDTHGALDGVVTLYPARRDAWEAEAQIEAEPVRGWRLGLVLHASRWQPGASPARGVTRDGVPVGEASYPGSRQLSQGLALRSSWAF